MLTPRTSDSWMRDDLSASLIDRQHLFPSKHSPSDCVVPMADRQTRGQVPSLFLLSNSFFSYQDRAIPVISSSVVQPPLSTGVFQGHYAPAPQLPPRFTGTFASGYVNPLTPYADDARRSVASANSYPRLPQRLHPALNSPQACQS